jgi:hypothetical protein
MERKKLLTRPLAIRAGGVDCTHVGNRTLLPTELGPKAFPAHRQKCRIQSADNARTTAVADSRTVARRPQGPPLMAVNGNSDQFFGFAFGHGSG